MVSEKTKKRLLTYYGLFYVALPHSVHQKISIDWLLGINLPHEVHVVIGGIMLFAAFKLK